MIAAWICRQPSPGWWTRPAPRPALTGNAAAHNVKAPDLDRDAQRQPHAPRRGNPTREAPIPPTPLGRDQGGRCLYGRVPTDRGDQGAFGAIHWGRRGPAFHLDA